MTADDPSGRSPHSGGTSDGPEGPPSLWDLPDRWRAPAEWDPNEPIGDPSVPSANDANAPSGGGPPRTAIDQSARAVPATAPAPLPASRPQTSSSPGEGPRGRRDPVPPKTGGPRTRRRRRNVLIAAAILLLAGVGVGIYYAFAHTSVGSSSLARAGEAGGSATPRTDDSQQPTASASPSATASASPVVAVAASDAAVPILMYHLIAAPPENAQYPELYVRPAVFARQMRYLHDQGYKAVTLRQVVNAWQGEETLPQKPVVISFDDGYPSHYQTAAPIMNEYRWVGLINADWNVLEKSSRLAAQVKLLAAAGWEIGSHSLTHPDLTTLDAVGLEREVAGSRQTIEKELGVEIETFCYPAGRYDDTVVAAVEAAGYSSATTTDPGLAVKSELYRLKRVRVNGSTTLSQFAAML